jgi:hypothetical protein
LVTGQPERNDTKNAGTLRDGGNRQQKNRSRIERTENPERPFDAKERQGVTGQEKDREKASRTDL